MDEQLNHKRTTIYFMNGPMYGESRVMPSYMQVGDTFQVPVFQELTVPFDANAPLTTTILEYRLMHMDDGMVAGVLATPSNH